MNSISEPNEKLKKYKNECGCTMGGQFTIVAFGISIFINIYHYGFVSIKFLSHLPLLLLFTLVAAGIGKILGILNAKYKYKRLLNSIKRGS